MKFQAFFHAFLLGGVMLWITAVPAIWAKESIEKLGDYIFKSDVDEPTSSIVSPNGSKTKYTSDKDGRLLSVVDTELGPMTYEYHDGHLANVMYPNGHEFAFDYDDKGRVQKVSYPDQTTVEYEYVLDDLISKVTLDFGVFEYRYDDSGTIQSFTDTNGDAFEFEVDAGNKLNGITYPSGEKGLEQHTNFTWTDFGKVKTEGSPFGRMFYDYDDRERLIAFMDSRGIKNFYEYENDSLYPSARTNQFGYTKYNEHGNVTHYLSVEGIITRLAWTDKGRLETVSNPIDGTLSGEGVESHSGIWPGLNGTSQVGATAQLQTSTTRIPNKTNIINGTQGLQISPLAGKFPTASEPAKVLNLTKQYCGCNGSSGSLPTEPTTKIYVNNFRRIDNLLGSFFQSGTALLFGVTAKAALSIGAAGTVPTAGSSTALGVATAIGIGALGAHTIPKSQSAGAAISRKIFTGPIEVKYTSNAQTSRGLAVRAFGEAMLKSARKNPIYGKLINTLLVGHAIRANEFIGIRAAHQVAGFANRKGLFKVSPTTIHTPSNYQGSIIFPGQQPTRSARPGYTPPSIPDPSYKPFTATDPSGRRQASQHVIQTPKQISQGTYNPSTITTPRNYQGSKIYPGVNPGGINLSTSLEYSITSNGIIEQLDSAVKQTTTESNNKSSEIDINGQAYKIAKLNLTPSQDEPAIHSESKPQDISAIGNFTRQDLDFCLEGAKSFCIGFYRFYDSFRVGKSLFGFGWTPLPYSMEISEHQFVVQLTDNAAGRAYDYRAIDPENNAQAEGMVSYESMDKSAPRLTKNIEGIFVVEEVGEATLEFNPQGDLLSMNLGSFALSYEYEHQNLVAMSTSNGTSLKLGYDPKGRIIRASLMDKEIATYGYDQSGNLVGRHLTEGETLAYHYNDAHHLQEIVSNSDTITVSYDEAGRMTSFDENGEILSFRYDVEGNKMSLVNSDNEETEVTFDEHNQIVSISWPDNSVTVNQYDADGNLIQIADGQSRIENGVKKVKFDQILTY